MWVTKLVTRSVTLDSLKWSRTMQRDRSKDFASICTFSSNILPKSPVKKSLTLVYFVLSRTNVASLSEARPERHKRLWSPHPPACVVNKTLCLSPFCFCVFLISYDLHQRLWVCWTWVTCLFNLKHCHFIDDNLYFVAFFSTSFHDLFKSFVEFISTWVVGMTILCRLSWKCGFGTDHTISSGNPKTMQHLFRLTAERA